MSAPPAMLTAAATRDALGAALREVHGDDARLADWTAVPLAKRGRHRTVRYEVTCRVGGAPDLRHHEWVGKLYERDEVARRVATVLRALDAAPGGSGGPLVVPRVVAYHAPARLLLLQYEAGQSIIAAMAQLDGAVPAAIGRALAALHGAPVVLDATPSPAGHLAELRRKVGELCARFPTAAAALHHTLTGLELGTPFGHGEPALLHGDLGPANVRWQDGAVVLLDFDACTRGDRALDLGNMLTQLRRLALRKPHKVPDFGSLRRGILDAYRHAAPPDPGLERRVGWYERATLLRKIHFLAFDTSRHESAGDAERRRTEAIGLLKVLPHLGESD